MGILILLLLVGILISFFYLKDGLKKSYPEINEEFNTEYYRRFKDWRLEFEEIESSEDEEEEKVFDGVIFYSLPAHEQEKARLLGLDQDFNFEQLKKAFLKKIKENHPDKFSSDPKKFREQNEICVKINAAFQELKTKHF